jgi:transposase-like protein
MKKKKLYTAEEKTIILREHLENNVSISELSEKYSLNPNVLYNWKKQLFEQAPKTLARKTKKNEKRQTKYESRIAELETLLSIRENLITELVAENIGLKKNLNGDILKRNGSNRR